MDDWRVEDWRVEDWRVEDWRVPTWQPGSRCVTVQLAYIHTGYGAQYTLLYNVHCADLQKVSTFPPAALSRNTKKIPKNAQIKTVAKA